MSGDIDDRPWKRTPRKGPEAAAAAAAAAAVRVARVGWEKSRTLERRY